MSRPSHSRSWRSRGGRNASELVGSRPRRVEPGSLAPGLPVFARYDGGGWWAATVEGIDDCTVRVRWDGGSGYDGGEGSVAVLPLYCVYSKL